MLRMLIWYKAIQTHFLMLWGLYWNGKQSGGVAPGANNLAFDLVTV